MVCQHQTKVEWETESEKQREQTKAIQKHKVIKVCALSDFYGVLQTSFFPLGIIRYVALFYVDDKYGQV